MYLRKFKRSAVLALSVALTLAGRSYGDVISERVPDGALAVVKFSNMAATSGKVAKLAEHLGVNMFVPALNDPLGALKQQLKITGGLQDDGDLALVYLDPKGADESKSMLFLVPTNDYKTLIANLEGATTEGDVTSAVGADGQTVYFADWDGYAAVSPAKEIVSAAAGKGLKLPARAAKETSENDVALYANFAALREPMMAKLTEGREKAKTELVDKMKAENNVPEKYHAAFGVGADQFFNAVEAFLRDADAATIGLTLTDEGIRQNVVAEFKEGSYLGNIANGFKNAEGTLLHSLPAGKYLMFGGFTNSPETINKLIDDVAGPVLKALPEGDEPASKVPAYVSDVKKFLGDVTGQSFGLVTPTGPIGQTAIFQPIGALQGDGEKLMAQMKDVNEKYASLVNDFLAGSQPGTEINQTWTDASRTVDGVTFNSITTEVAGDSPAANQQRQSMQFMYGTSKVEMLFGSTGDEVVSFVNGTDDATVNALIANAKENKSPLADLETVKAVQGELPEKRIMELYVGVDEIVGLGLRAAKQFNFFQGEVQLPPDLQPVGLSLASDGGAIEYRAYISNDLLQAIVSAGMQAAAQMQGGGQGQRGGGL